MNLLSLITILMVSAFSRSMRVHVGKSTSGPFTRCDIKPNIKLPVWPVWGGVIAQLADWAGQGRISEFIVKTIGGRVVPITLSDTDVSPFLLLAHHAHSFTPFDPIRALTRLVLPEGFPAHPHSGFDTVTYCIDGGLVHRDSEGLKMAYGNGDVQWMRAGRGVIHEEMWNVEKRDERHQRIEIFQLWVNLPKSSKLDPPQATLLKASDIPVWKGTSGELIRVICGSISDDSSESDMTGPGSSIAASPVAILHVTVPPGIQCSLSHPKGSSAVMYVRQGSQIAEDTEVFAGDTVYFRSSKDAIQSDITSTFTAGEFGFDGLVLIGEALNEPVVWSGPFVQASERDLSIASRTFNGIGMGAFWDYRMTDQDWYKHVRKLNLQDYIREVLNLDR